MIARGSVEEVKVNMNSNTNVADRQTDDEVSMNYSIT